MRDRGGSGAVRGPAVMRDLRSERWGCGRGAGAPPCAPAVAPAPRASPIPQPRAGAASGGTPGVGSAPRPASPRVPHPAPEMPELPHFTPNGAGRAWVGPGSPPGGCRGPQAQQGQASPVTGGYSAGEKKRESGVWLSSVLINYHSLGRGELSLFGDLTQAAMATAGKYCIRAHHPAAEIRSREGQGQPEPPARSPDWRFEDQPAVMLRTSEITRPGRHSRRWPNPPTVPQHPRGAMGAPQTRSELGGL